MRNAYYPLLLCVLLVACGSDEYSDIKEWMAEESKGIKSNVQMPPPMSAPPIVSYSAKELESPFAPDKIKSKESGPIDKASPAAGRPLEYLEGFPLEAMRLIGTVHYRGAMYGIIQTPEKPKHVTVGNYIGPNYGKIVEISKTQMRVSETVRDANDLWIQREKILYLQQDEGAKK